MSHGREFAVPSPPMKLAVLRFFARRPLALVGLGVTFAAIGLAAIGSHVLCPTERETAGPSAAVDALDNPRKILSRGWYDSWPEKRTDVLRFYYFGGGGIGLYDEGSSYRYSIDVFDLERQNNKLTIKFLQDGKVTETTFTVTPCTEKYPFDLCLDLADSPRGPKRFYSWDDDEDNTDRLPDWAAERVRQARARMGE